MNENTKKAYEDFIALLGCGDNSCNYKRPSGMATNGGCRCIENLTYCQEAYLRRLLRLLKKEYEEEKNNAH